MSSVHRRAGAGAHSASIEVTTLPGAGALQPNVTLLFDDGEQQSADDGSRDSRPGRRDRSSAREQLSSVRLIADDADVAAGALLGERANASVASSRHDGIAGPSTPGRSPRARPDRKPHGIAATVTGARAASGRPDATGW